LPLLSDDAKIKATTTPIELYDERGWRQGRLIGRGGLGGKPIAGPALIEDPTSTLLVPTGWTARRDENHNTILERRAK